MRSWFLITIWWVWVVLSLSNIGILGCLEAESNALLKLKYALNYPNYTFLPSWDKQRRQDCCAWEYVICDNTTNRVVQLLLGGTKSEVDDWNRALWSLNASDLFPLKELQVLDLSDNYLNEIFGVFGLEKLQELDLSYNELEKASFSVSPYLIALKLSHNSLSDLPIFLELSASSKLEVLKAGFNRLNGSFPKSIGALNSLKAVSFASNQLNGQLAAEEVLCKLKHLEGLDVSDNTFTGHLPPCLSNLTSLQLLDVSYNKLEGTMSSALISSLKSVQYISLSGNNFEGLFLLSWLANNSNLQYFDFSCHNSLFKVETEDLLFLPQFQLKFFRSSHCPRNGIPKFLFHQYDLKGLDLSHNQIRGRFPQWLMKNNTRLEYLRLSGNYLTAPLELNSTSFYPSMQVFDVSDNHLHGEIPYDIGSIFPNLHTMNMSNNALQGSIPDSIGDIRGLVQLTLASNTLSGHTPDKLFINCKYLWSLNLANNKLEGQILPKKSNLTKLRFLNLNNNCFSGEISGDLINSPYLITLEISDNNLSGKLPNWIGNLTYLKYLQLSGNNLDGPIPLCQFPQLEGLDLSRNNFNQIESHCEVNKLQWKYLKLESNNLRGTISSVFSKAVSSLILLDLGNNHLCGEIPDWISSLSHLRVLVLRENRLTGLIPLALCQLRNLTILDLASNKFSGEILSCFHDMAFGRFDVVFDTNDWGSFQFLWLIYDGPIFREYDRFENMEIFPSQEVVKFMMKKRLELYKGITLRLMSGIDLSCNKLTGKIPAEIGYLGSMIGLNLSNNLLSGPIPETFSNLKNIESLDLSHNTLSSHIPSQLTQLYELSTFSVAYNNLSGSIPMMIYQFQTFERSSYEGNPLLCGPPLDISCSLQGASPVATSSVSREDDFNEAFLWTFISTFVIAFLGAIAFLYINHYFQINRKTQLRAPCMYSHIMH